MLKVLIATGGTGGHLFPALQLKKKLGDCDVIFAGHRLEKSPFFDREQTFVEICSARKIKQIPKLLKGIWQSIRLIRSFSPDVIVGFGSFHSFPVLFAAMLLRKKIVIFEANCSLGKVNKFFSPFAKKVAFQFPVKHKKAAYVPLLPWGKKEVSIKKYDKDPERLTILVFGGSQGADFINRMFPKTAQHLTFPFQVIHLTGKTNLKIKYSVPSVVMEFESDMEAAYSVADIVVCRAGASSIAEIIQHQKPAVLIPYPYAYSHQKKNAEFIQKGTKCLMQDEITPERLAAEIEHVRQNLSAYKKELHTLTLPDPIPIENLIKTVGGH